MNWYILAILSVFALATAELLQQHLVNKDRVFNERSSIVATFAVMLPFALVFIFFTPSRYQFFSVFNPAVFPYLLLSSVTSSIAIYFYIKSFIVNNISISTIFISLSVVVSTVLGIVFFKESVSLIKFLGIFLVIASVISLNIKNRLLEKNHLFGIVAGVMFGITYTIDKFIVIETDPLVYLFWIFLLVCYIGLTQSFRTVIRHVKSVSSKGFKYLLLSGFGYFIYNYCAFKAYDLGGEVGVIDAINNTQIFLIILAEYFILKQKDDVYRKILTTAVAFTGVYILGNI